MLFVINSSLRKEIDGDLKEIKVVPIKNQLTKEEQEEQDKQDKIENRDIRNRVLFLIIFFITLIIVYFIK